MTAIIDVVGTPTTIEICVLRVIRLTAWPECHCHVTRPRRFDVAVTDDARAFTREAGAPDSAPWRSIALSLPVTLEILEVYRANHDEPLKKADPDDPKAIDTEQARQRAESRTKPRRRAGGRFARSGGDD